MESDQQPLLAKPSDTTKECMNTRVKIMLYSLIYNCAFTITTTIEPQFVYSYLKNQYKNNSNIEAMNYSKIEAKTCVQNSTSSDDRLQELSSDWSWYMQLAEAGVSLPVLMIVGPIADRIGRKPVLMWNLIITLFSFVFKTVIVYRNMNLYYYTVACGILGLAGSFYAYQITNFAILADITTGGKDRSFMMTLYDALSAIGVVTFQIGTGYLIQLIGFTDPYLISTGMFLFMCIFVQITLLDSWRPPDKLAKLRIKEITLELFSFCLNDHSMNKSYKLVTFVLEYLSYCLFYIPHCVVISILTLYQLGMPFCWMSEHIGWYGAGASFVSFIGGVIILKIMHTMCGGLKDEMITLLGMLSYLSTYILYGVSSTDWILYAAIPAGIIRLLPISLVRALMSQMIHSDKQGVLYSAIHVMEAIGRIGGATLFNNIYHQTLSIYHGLVFFIMAGFVFIAFILMTYASCSKSKKIERELEKEEPAIQKVDTEQKDM